MALFAVNAHLMPLAVGDWRTTSDTASASQEIVTSKNGGDGHDGASGSPGTMSTPPGSGHDGHLGKDSAGVFNGGDSLKFSKHHPIGTWTMSSQAGNGGDGGDGGKAGTFPHGAHYAATWASGGNGADGGDSGETHTEPIGLTVYGRSGTGAGDGINFTFSAIDGNGGNGGNGAGGDGDTSRMTQGGDGGDGGDGGAASDTVDLLINNVFKPTSTHGAGSFNITLTLTARSGNGGNGGDGGHGGASSGTRGTDGSGGDGGAGGFASVSFQGDSFQLAGKTGDQSMLSIVADAQAGNGGDGGSLAGHPHTNDGTGGAAGGAGLFMENTTVSGGAEDDLVRLSLNAINGNGGTNPAGVQQPGGEPSVAWDGNTFDGGGGNNTLAFGGEGIAASNVSVEVDLTHQTFDVGDTADDNTIRNFRNVTGGAADDIITGDKHANVLDGGLGADLLNGGGGHDAFVYATAHDSTGVDHDRIVDLNFNQDRIDVPTPITAVDKEIRNADLHTATFDDDLAAAANKHHLGADSAVLVSGEMEVSGVVSVHKFLVIDANGKAGYQAGGDFVIEVTGAVGHLTTGDFI